MEYSLSRQFSPTRENWESVDWRRFGVSAWGIAITNDMRTSLITDAASAPGPSDCSCASSGGCDGGGSGTGPRRKSRLQVPPGRSCGDVACRDDDVWSASTDNGYVYVPTILAGCWHAYCTA